MRIVMNTYDKGYQHYADEIMQTLLSDDVNNAVAECLQFKVR